MNSFASHSRSDARKVRLTDILPPRARVSYVRVSCVRCCHRDRIERDALSRHCSLLPLGMLDWTRPNSLSGTSKSHWFMCVLIEALNT
jgi:hypothetical protein